MFVLHSVWSFWQEKIKKNKIKARCRFGFCKRYKNWCQAWRQMVSMSLSNKMINSLWAYHTWIFILSVLTQGTELKMMSQRHAEEENKRQRQTTLRSASFREWHFLFVIFFFSARCTVTLFLTLFSNVKENYKSHI